ncbi:unnamed protein product [Colias eurytheme]|nr:unnamed protein product [Colias eurytheme]
MWADSIFGIDVSVRELAVNQELSPTFGRLPDIVEEVYSAIGGDDKNFNKQMTKNMLMYYTTAILWSRLLEIKAKRGNANLTFKELEYCKFMTSQEFNIPQPLYLFLKGIGEVKDATGKTVSLADHTLPETVVQGLGGYHAAEVDANSHNLYEEIPCLGICGDMLMAETSEDVNPTPNFRVLPARTRATRALIGNFGPIGLRKEEVKISLESVGIRTTTFEEQITGTRLNIRLVQLVSDYLAGTPTFRNEKVKVDALTIEGDSAQLIRSIPTSENTDANARWTQLVIRPTAANACPVTTFGASYIMGYQLYKEVIATSHQNWCCVEAQPVENPWTIPQEWIDNRNAKRELPNGLDISRFVSISDSQSNRTNAIVRRMIVSQR